MTAIKAPATVLVTGASGFIAVWVVKTFLEAGYSVRGTVRSASKGDYLVNLFKSYGDKFQYVIVEDIVKEGAFDEAVKGVDAVAHTASPFHFHADDPETLIDPAVKGTIGVLASVHKYAPTVQRIVITSSVAAIMDSSKPNGTVFTESDWNTFSPREIETKGKAAAGGVLASVHKYAPTVQRIVITSSVAAIMDGSKPSGTVFTESDWNTFSPREIETKGKAAAGGDKYRASKTLAEKAAWAFLEERQPKYDIATINPPMVCFST
ncbi:hypothetical protein RSAG8_01312, partial [Rhizoctonia solani AG-8 WAC10335]